jgi:general stress protein 26
MSETPSNADLEHRLWREIDHARTLMLGLAGGPPRHMQPMTAFTDEHDGTIWFYLRKDNDLLKQAGDGHAAMACLMSKDHGFIACIGGDLAPHYDRDRIDRFWNPIASAWFPDGKDDPNLTLLRFDPTDAQVWVSQSNPVSFGFALAKAKLTKTVPDVGTATHLNL